MKIIYGNDFLSKMQRKDSFVKITKYAIGNVYTVADVAKNPQALFNLSYLEGDVRHLGRYDLEAIWESNDRTLRINLSVPDEAKESLSSDNYELIYVFYNDLCKEEDQIAFILADVRIENGLYTFHSINTFSGASSDQEVDNPVVVGESLSNSDNYFKITIPNKIKGNFLTSLTNNAYLLEGPGLLGENWFSLSESDVNLISRSSYEVALLDVISSSESIVYPYLDNLGAKKYETYKYRTYSNLVVYTTPELSQGYINPKSIILDSAGGVIELSGNADYEEFVVSSGVVVKVGSGTEQLGNIPGISVDLIELSVNGFNLVSGNDGNKLYIICPESPTAESRYGVFNIHLDYCEGIGGEIKSIYPTNLVGGKLRILQNEVSNWFIKYPDTSFFEDNTPLYLFSSSAGETRDILIKTSEFSNKSSFTISVDQENTFSEWFDVSLYNFSEFKNITAAQIDSYVSQLLSIEDRLSNFDQWKKINGILSGALLRNWTYTVNQFKLLKEVRDFCLLNYEILLDPNKIMARQLDNLISFIEPNVTNNVGRSDYFTKELNNYLAEDGDYEDYRGHYQYLYLLSQYDKSSYSRATSNLLMKNIEEANGSMRLDTPVEEELSEYLRTNLLAYFSKLYYYLVIENSSFKQRYINTVKSIIVDGNFTWVENKKEPGYNLFYVKITSRSNNDTESWGPKRTNSNSPLKVSVCGKNSSIERTIDFYCVQKPRTIDLLSVYLGNDEIAYQSKSIDLGYPENNNSVSDSIIIIGSPDSSSRVKNFKWGVYSYDSRISITSSSFGSLIENTVNYSDGGTISISNPISFSTTYKSNQPTRVEFSKFIIIGCEDLDSRLLLDESLLFDWRKNTTLSRLEIPVYQRGYKPIINEFTSEIELDNLGYYTVQVISNSDIKVNTLLDGLSLVKIEWDGKYSENVFSKAKLTLLYSGATDSIMNYGNIGYRTEKILEIIPSSDDLDYWYPEGYESKTVSARISLFPSTRFSIDPLPDSFYIRPGDLKEITIVSPGRRVYGTTTNPDLTVLSPEITVSGSKYVNHKSYISATGSVSATGFPLSSSSTVSYWASGNREGTESNYDVYVLPDRNFVTITGDERGYIYLPSSAIGSKTLTLNSVNGVKLKLVVEGSGFKIDDFSEDSTRQVLTITADTANEELLDRILGTIEISSYVRSDQVVSGKVMSEDLSGNSYTFYVIQMGLSGKMGLGGSNDLVLPISGVSSKYLLGSVSRPSEDYNVQITSTNNLNIWLGSWVNNKASLYISDIPSHVGYVPSLVYDKDNYGWEGISSTINFGKIKIKVGEDYEEIHSVIQPGISTGILISDRFYLGTHTIEVVSNSDTYTLRAGEYSTSSELSSQVGKRVYFSTQENVKVITNNSPIGDTVVSLPEEPGTYSITAGKLTILINRLNSIYQVFSDSIVEIDSKGNQINNVIISGNLPYGMSISQVIPKSENSGVVGFIGSDGNLNVWLDRECHEEENIRSFIDFIVPGQSTVAGEVEYIQYTAHVGINDKIFKFTSDGTNITKDIVIIGQVNSIEKPRISVNKSKLPEYVGSLDFEIIESSREGQYQLVCRLSITPGSKDLKNFNVEGVIIANYVTQLGGSEFECPFTYTFYYIG